MPTERISRENTKETIIITLLRVTIKFTHSDNSSFFSSAIAILSLCRLEWPNIYMLTTLAFENFLQGESWENCLVSKSIGWCALYQSLLKRDEWNVLRNTVVINKKKNVYRVIHSVAILTNSHIWHPAVTSLYVLITILFFFFYRYVIRVWKQYFARR